MAKHSVSSYRATGMLSRFNVGCDIYIYIYIYMCVCVCVRAIASQRKGIPESTTRVCVVPGPRFAGGGPGSDDDGCSHIWQNSVHNTHQNREQKIQDRASTQHTIRGHSGTEQNNTPITYQPQARQNRKQICRTGHYTTHNTEPHRTEQI